ncbi:efflux RND transporter periplasmic adaptor subunit [Vibrio ezurae]|uniref:Putative efflux system protein n=1 Tax=Vibrio ezurae NBRC 102218 TaxID=1219080 RepID=U3B4P5_9VIBR|nr:efflux RND transporter periplasmic adaptor subunit [Vibrio ezurae]GAD80417.1 putative efflux system protein [Vibrio ezurae NBRC 102218]
MKRALTVAIFCALLSGCFSEQAPLTPPTLQLKTFEVKQQIPLGDREFNGVSVPADITPLAFVNAGEITHIPVKAGDKIVKGQVLATLDDTRIVQQLQQAKVELDLANKQRERALQLTTKNMISHSEFDAINSKQQLANIQYQSLQRRLFQTRLLAPFDATIASVEKEVAENVNSAEAILTIYRHDRIQVDINVTEETLLSLKPKLGTQVQIQFENLSQPINAKLMLWSAEPIANHSNYLMRFEANQTSSHVLPGTAAQVVIPSLNASQTLAFLIPANTLVAGNKPASFSVWLYKNHQLIPQNVTVNAITKEGAVISKGLQQGDLLITNQLSKLTHQRPFTITGEVSQ